MKYYAIQVKTNAENNFIKLFKFLHPEVSLPIYFLQRSLDIRRKGSVLTSTAPVFPGYLFVKTENDDEIHEHQFKFRRTDGFYRFLISNNMITPLSKRDLETVLPFVNCKNQTAGKSSVYFDDNSRIVVLEGPLMGLEGKIIKADRRKGRAKILLDLYDNSFLIDLGFNVIGKPNGQA